MKISKERTNFDRASVERKTPSVKGSIVGAFENDICIRHGRGSWSWSGLGKGREEGNCGGDGKGLHYEDSDRFDEAGCLIGVSLEGRMLDLLRLSWYREKELRSRPYILSTGMGGGHAIVPGCAATCCASMSGVCKATEIPSANALRRRTCSCLSDPNSAIQMLEVIKLERRLAQRDVNWNPAGGLHKTM